MLRGVERGTDAINFLVNFLVFNIGPLAIEIVAVCIVLLSSYVGYFALILFLSIGAYATYTILVTEWRSKFRKEMNEANNLATNKAVDSLLNFETVKYFNNEEHEIGRYNGALMKYNAAAIKSTTTLSLLNVGQGIIRALGCKYHILYSYTIFIYSIHILTQPQYWR
mgnify:FL=1